MTERYRDWYGFLVFLCMVVLCSAQPGRALVISEVMYHPPDQPEATEAELLEFIEIYNDRAVSEEMGGWAFTDGIEYTFPPDLLLGPKQYLVIARDPNAVMSAYGITGVLGPYTGRLDNAGERVALSEANGQIVLSVEYNEAPPWPASPDGAGHSLIRALLGGDAENVSTWAASTLIGGTPGGPDQVQAEPDDPTLVTLLEIGDPGRYFKGTAEPSLGPGRQPSTAWTEIGFADDPGTTAWEQGPQGYGYSNDASELQYVRTLLNDMRGGYLSFYVRLPLELTEEQMATFSQLRAEVHYDDAFVLYLNGTRIAASGDIDGNPPAHDRSANGAGEPPTASIDLTAHRDLLVAGNNILALQVHNASISGSSDCYGGVVVRGVIETAVPTEDPDARVLINEVLANSDAPPGTDWIELYNPGPTAVTLTNVYLSDDPRDLLQYKVPDGTVLEPGQFWTVREGTPPNGFPFGLDFSGETVYLTVASAGPDPVPLRVIDALRYGNMEPEVTFGRYPDGADSLDCLAAPTFGTANEHRLIGDVVINEIMYHHLERKEEFEYVELYNQGASTVPLDGWAFTDGIDYTFPSGAVLPTDGYVVVAKDPNFLAEVYDNLIVGSNLFGPYEGKLNNHSERVRLSYPRTMTDPSTGKPRPYMITADQVTYTGGGRWPTWADGRGASLELRDPRSHNDVPEAWADSDESGKTQWQKFSFTIGGSDSHYSHASTNIFDMMLLNAGEILLDDVEVLFDGSNRVTNGGFESGPSSWRILGNHVRSFVTPEESRSGARALHLIATGHGDPGANRINQSISGPGDAAITFRGWARWLRGSRFLLLRTARELSPRQPPWPSHAFELDVPLDLGTPGRRNSVHLTNRGPDIREVRHVPVIPKAGEAVVITARVEDNDGVGVVALYHRYEGAGPFVSMPMLDDGQGDDMAAGDGLYTATLQGAGAGMMRAFYIEATDGSASTRFPTKLQPSAPVPDRTCLIRTGDPLVSTRIAGYRVWMSDDVVDAFRSRPNLSNELMDCTFVYNDSEVFYNCKLRHRGSPFLRNGAGRSPSPGNRHGYRIEFPADQKLRGCDEINLDGTEGGGRGPLQERASYWFYKEMGLQYSRQEYVRLIMNGQVANNAYEHVQKVDGEYVDQWFPENREGYIHKIDDYFEYDAAGTRHRNLDEGLKHDSQHPPISETYRWGFEKRGHRENDKWQHLVEFAIAMNASSSSPSYEQRLERLMDPEHFASVLAVRKAVGDWDSYGFERGKNNYFYYALPEGKWFLLPWDIDFTLGSGRGAHHDLFALDSGEFPEVHEFLNHPKYKRMYVAAFSELVDGPWQTSYGTNDPPTKFDRFLDEAADLLVSEGFGDGRRNQIKRFVRDRGNYILQIVAENDDEPNRRRPQ